MQRTLAFSDLSSDGVTIKIVDTAEFTIRQRLPGQGGDLDIHRARQGGLDIKRQDERRSHSGVLSNTGGCSGSRHSPITSSRSGRRAQMAASAVSKTALGGLLASTRITRAASSTRITRAASVSATRARHAS